MARRRDDDSDLGERRTRRREAAGRQETSAPQGAGGGGGRGTVGPTGYDYSGWGSDFQLGSRPPAKTDWDAMSDDERAAVGLPDWDSFHNAQRAWRANFQEGGGNFEAQAEIARAIANSGAQDWNQISNVLGGLGYRDVKEEGRALWRRLKMAYEGNADPSGRYHRVGDQWADVGTSDLGRRSIAGRADMSNFTPMQGRSAVLAGLKGGDTVMRFQDWMNEGKSSIEGYDPTTGYYYNDSPGGGRAYYDAGGYQIDPSTGQTIGHYASGLGYVGGMGAGAGPVTSGVAVGRPAAAPVAAAATPDPSVAAAAAAPPVSMARPSPSLYSYPTQDPLNERKRQQQTAQPRAAGMGGGYGGSYGPSGMTAGQGPQSTWRSAGMGQRRPMYG